MITFKIKTLCLCVLINKCYMQLWRTDVARMVDSTVTMI